MQGFDLDLLVIGGGSGGVRAGRMAAEAGARTAVAEADRFGGTCVIRGCVPKKLFVYASAFAHAFEDSAGFGWEVGARRFDWGAFIAAKDREVARLEAAYRGGLERAGARVIAARAVLEDPHAVRLSTGERLRARHILVATGARPLRPDFPGAALAITSDDLFRLPAQPASIVIVGGGYIACEFAFVLAGLGTRVTLVHRGERILRGFDEDLRGHVQAAMAAAGIALRLGEAVAAARGTPGGVAVTLRSGDALAADLLMVATGRAPNSAGMGLEAAGVLLAPNGAVMVDRWSQSSVPSVYAVGDVTDRRALTPAAIREGAAFVRTVFLADPVPVDHDLVPTAVFTQPEIGTVGLTEEEARARGPVRIFRTVFRPMLHTLSGRDERMLMKLVVDAGTDRVLGVHIAGHGAAEMIQLAAIPLGMGATKADFDRTLPVHPTAAEELVTLRQPVAEA